MSASEAIEPPSADIPEPSLERSSNAALSLKNDEGKSPLHLAAKWGLRELIQLILANDANPNAQDKCGRTPLHLAAESGHYEDVKTLLLHGADRSIQDANGNTPLLLAIRGKKTKVAILLISDGAIRGSKCINTQLLSAAMNGSYEYIQALVDCGADPNFKDGDGKTPLIYAAMGGHTGIAQSLLGFGADPNIKDNDGMTPLSYAARNKHPVIVKSLLSRDADPNSRDKYSKTPLSYAIENGREEIIPLLTPITRPNTEQINNTSPLRTNEGAAFGLDRIDWKDGDDAVTEKPQCNETRVQGHAAKTTLFSF